MAGPTFQEEDYPVNKQGLNKLLCVVSEAIEGLEAGTWGQQKLQRFATLITSHPGRWQQAVMMIWQLRPHYDTGITPQEWSANIRKLYELTQEYRKKNGLDLRLSASKMREAKRLNLSDIEERIHGFFEAQMPFPDRHQPNVMKALASVVQLLDPAFQMDINDSAPQTSGSGQSQGAKGQPTKPKPFEKKNFAELLVALENGQLEVSEARLKHSWEDVAALASDNPNWQSFASDRQQEAVDLFNALIEPFCPQIREVFLMLTLEMTYRCKSCHTEKTTASPDHLEMITASIPDAPNNHDLKLENLIPIGDQYPEYLVVRLDRSEHVIGDMVWKKEDVVEYSVDEVTMPGDAKYQVQTVVCHVGAHTTVGHYCAFLRGDDGWYRLDDAVKTKVTNVSGLVTGDAYLLFLRKKATTGADEGLASSTADVDAVQKLVETDAAQKKAKAGAAKAAAECEARRMGKQRQKEKATKEKARIAAASADPDKAEADAKAEGRLMSEGEKEAVRLARWALHRVPETASEAESSSANEGGGKFATGGSASIPTTLSSGSGPHSGAFSIRSIDTRFLSKFWSVEELGKKAPVSQEPSPINTDTTSEYNDASSAGTETASKATEGDQITDDNNDEAIKDKPASCKICE
ncbi:hypothetical protein N0V86_007748 [Didymella sp. IMI 355093]|nr:hypothetical protein N0V86_007748 [Didymella sp. IMI 355093]